MSTGHVNLLSTLLTLVYILDSVHGHGMLLEPPSRSSAWRAGFNTPKNYDDNALFCGGSARKQSNGGKCGVCGDPWDAPEPRDNEAGGIYATGIIVRNYTAGQVVKVRIQLTANHLGWMEFRLCPNDDVTKPITHDCLNRHLLSFADGSGTRYHVTTGRSGYYNMLLKLPQGITCTQCVLQWKYHGGNSWGVDPVTKRGCVGCGPQEEFYGCADIGIGQSGNVHSGVQAHVSSATSTTSKPLRTTTTTRAAATTSAHVSSLKVCRAIGVFAGNTVFDKWCTQECSRGACSTSYCQCSETQLIPLNLRPATTTITTTTTTTTPPPLHAQCAGKGAFSGPQWDTYCIQQCNLGYCAVSVCNC